MADQFQPFGVLPNGSTRSILLYTANAGETVAVTISKNGAAFANPSGGATNATPVSNGWYTFTPSATDTGTDGPLLVKGNGGGNLAYAYGSVLNSIPTAQAGATNGALIAGSNAATTFASLTCTGAFTISDGLSVSRSTSNGTAVFFSGNGSGSGFNISGGGSGSGMVIIGQSNHGLVIGCDGANKNALNISGSPDGGTDAAIRILPGSSGLSLLTAGGVTMSGVIAATNASNDFRINGKVPGAANGLHVLGSNVGDTKYTASSGDTAGVEYVGVGTGAGMRIESGVGISARGLTIVSNAGSGQGDAVLLSNTSTGVSINAGSWSAENTTVGPPTDIVGAIARLCRWFGFKGTKVIHGQSPSETIAARNDGDSADLSVVTLTRSGTTETITRTT